MEHADTNTPDPALQRLRSATPQEWQDETQRAVLIGYLRDLPHGEWPKFAARIGITESDLRLTYRAHWRKTGGDFRERGDIPMPQVAANVVEFLRCEDIRVSYDSFADRTAVDWCGSVSPLTDALVDKLSYEAHEHYDFFPALETFWRVLRGAALDNTFDPVRDWLEELPAWDGVERADGFLIDLMGVEDTPLNREFTRVFMTSIVARIMVPGIKADTCLVLEGPQGAGKSTLLRELCPIPGTFTDAGDARASSKEVIEITRGKLIVEIPEFSGLKKAEVEHLKQMLSTQVDNARMSYDRVATDKPRRFVFAATTNEEEYLRDATGGRRFLPLRVTKTVHEAELVDAMKKLRPLIYAETRDRFLAKEWAPSVHADLWKDAAEVQASRLEANEYLDLLGPLFGLKAGWITTAEVGKLCDLRAGASTAWAMKRVADCMKALGWHKTRVRVGGELHRIFYRHPAGWRATEAGAVLSCIDAAGKCFELPRVEVSDAEVRRYAAGRDGVDVNEDGAVAGVVMVEGGKWKVVNRVNGVAEPKRKPR